MTPGIVQRLRDTAVGRRHERVSMHAVSQARGPGAHGVLDHGHAMPAPGTGCGHGRRAGNDDAGGAWQVV